MDFDAHGVAAGNGEQVACGGEDVVGVAGVAGGRRFDLHVAEREGGCDRGGVGADDESAAGACDGVAERLDDVDAQSDAREEHVHAPPPGCQPPAGPL